MRSVSAKQRPTKTDRVPSKVDNTYERLLSMAHHLGPQAKMPTVRRLREEMSVSQTTLDAALARLEERHILVRRQGSGVYVSSRLRQRNIALLCEPEYFLRYGASPFWGLLVDRIRSIAARNEAHLSLHFLRSWTQDELVNPEDSSPLHPTLLDEIAAGKIHGVISIGAPHPVARWIESHGVPVVAYAGAAQYIIGQSDAVLMQMGMVELVRQGCRRIEPLLHHYTHRPDIAVAWHGQYDVYRGAMLAHGLQPVPSSQLALEMDDASTTNVERGFQLALMRFGPSVPPEERAEAVISEDDMMTQGFLMGLYRLGLRPNQDIKIATHANAGSSVLLAWQDDLIRLEYDFSLLVDLLFKTLDALMNAEQPDWESEALRTPEFYYLLVPRLVLPHTDDAS